MNMSFEGSAALSCAAVELSKTVDEQINGGARQEAEDATDALQETGADLGEGSAYLDGSEVIFTERTVNCGLCKRIASLNRDGSIEAPFCPVSGSCEMAWAERYPLHYCDAAGTPTARRLPCGAEIGCSALVGITNPNGTLRARVASGVCEVARRDANWKATSAAEIARTHTTNPEAGIEKFDGEGSGREE